MAREPRDISWIKRKFRRRRGAKDGDETTNTNAEFQASEGYKQPRTTRRRSLRDRLTSRSAQSLSLQGQLMSKASAKILRRRRSSTTGYTSDELEQQSTQPSLHRSSSKTSVVNLSQSCTSVDKLAPRPAPAPGHMRTSRLLQRTKTITFEDQRYEEAANSPRNSAPAPESSVVESSGIVEANQISCASDSSHAQPPLSKVSLPPLPDNSPFSTNAQPNDISPAHHMRNNEPEYLTGHEQHDEIIQTVDDVSLPDVNITDSGSRPTQIIEITDEVFEEPEPSSSDFFSIFEDMNTDQEQSGSSQAVSLVGVGSWVTTPGDSYYLRSPKIPYAIQELQDTPIDKRVIISFLSLDSELAYIVQISDHVGRNGPFVSAWLLYCIAVLRIEKLRLSLFLQATLLGVGINLSGRSDLNPDELVTSTWYTDEASVVWRHPSSPIGKHNSGRKKVLSNTPQIVPTPQIMKGSVVTDAPKTSNVRHNIVAVDVSVKETYSKHLTSDNKQHQPTSASLNGDNVHTRVQQIWKPSSERALLRSKGGQSIEQDIPLRSSHATQAVASIHAAGGTGTELANGNSKSGELKKPPTADSNSQYGLEASICLREDDSERNSAAEDAGEMQQTQLMMQNTRMQYSGRRFFVRGRVFSVLWHRSTLPYSRGPRGVAAEAGQVRSSRISTPTVNQDFPDSHIRTFVVVTRIQNFCLAVPISSYGGKGLTETRFSETERKGHAIVYYEGDTPHRLRGEPSFTKEAIAVKQPSPAMTMDPASRINFRKPTTIEWNSQVDDLGIVSSKSIDNLTTYFVNEVCRDQ